MFILDKSEVFTKAGMEHLNDSIRTSVWAILASISTSLPHGTLFDIATPNEVHQADLLFLPHDQFGKRTYKYALTVASRYKEAEPLATKEAKEVAEALSHIYRRG
ncbi:MAG: hypothetical protein AB2556_24415 [Candidatus Thiodiazotropha sp.]